MQREGNVFLVSGSAVNGTYGLDLLINHQQTSRTAASGSSSRPRSNSLHLLLSGKSHANKSAPNNKGMNLISKGSHTDSHGAAGGSTHTQTLMASSSVLRLASDPWRSRKGGGGKKKKEKEKLKRRKQRSEY